MQQTHFGRGGSVPWILSSILLAIPWCTGSAAASRQHDQLTISGSPARSVTAGQAYSFTPTATDSRHRRLTFAIANLPRWASFNANTGRLSGTPSTASVGAYSGIVISVSDGWKSAALPSFSVRVLPVAASPSQAPSPTISGTPATTDVVGSPYAFQPSATGPSGMTLYFSVQNLPPWATFSIASGRLSGTPSSSQVGTYGNIIISVSDGQASSALPPFAITVTASPATGSATLSWTAPTQNTDGSALTDLAGFDIYYGTSASNLSRMVQVAGSSQTGYTISSLAAGTWYFGTTAYTTAGTQSAMSAVVSKAIP